MKLLLFDVDHTLISTGGAGIRALNRAFQKILSMDGACEGVALHGKTDVAIIREIFIAKTGADECMNGAVNSIVESYLSFLHEEVALSPAYRVLPGIAEFLDEMAERSDVLLGLATGNVERGARIKLKRGDLNRYFAFGGFGCDAEDRTALVRRAAERAQDTLRAAIAPEDVYVIGDTPRDIDAGRRAGFRTVGVATGTYTVEELQEAGASIVVSDFANGRDHFLRSTFIVT